MNGPFAQADFAARFGPGQQFLSAGEFLRHAKLNDQQRSLVMALRDDRVRLLGSRAYDAAGPHSLGAAEKAARVLG